MEILSNTLSKVPILHLGRIWYYKPDRLGLISIDSYNIILLRVGGVTAPRAQMQIYINQLHFVLLKVFSDRNCPDWCKIRTDALFQMDERTGRHTLNTR